MKILVFGGAGYIGSHTVYSLIEQGDEVIVFDNLVDSVLDVEKILTQLFILRQIHLSAKV